MSMPPPRLPRPPLPMPALRTAWLRRGLWLLAFLALAGVFCLYLNPHFMVDVAGRFWSCV